MITTQTINQNFFKPVLQYNQENLENINNICAPLKDCFEIIHFCYWRIFNDGRYILVSNSRCFQEVISCYDFCFKSEYFSEMTQHLCKREPYKHLFPDNIKDESLEILQENNVHNTFNIIKERENSLESYYFATDMNSPLIKELYLHNSSILEEFISHFHKVGYELCDSSDVTKQGTSPYLRKTYPDIEGIFKRVDLWEDKALEFNSLLHSNQQEKIREMARKNALSPRELQCLIRLSTAKTAKEIAHELNLSPRTVETHIDKIRLKTACNTQKEIIQWFEMNFGYFLTDSTSRAQLIKSIESEY
jgi:DNA-binding CsgD family transcriptional regulator